MCLTNRFHAYVKLAPVLAYLVKTIDKCKPEYYEIYETASKWMDWLTIVFDILTEDCLDGETTQKWLASGSELYYQHDNQTIYDRFLLTTWIRMCGQLLCHVASRKNPLLCV